MTMKRILPLVLIILWVVHTTHGQETETGYLIEKEIDIARVDSLHFGGGQTIGYSFFNDVEGLNFVFRKRVLKPGSEIMYHLQKSHEIYYILEGVGEMKINDDIFSVRSGDAVLTLPGNYHGLKPEEDGEIVILIMYEKH